jgi:hypothetical protein
MSVGKVTEWKMTQEELQAYIEKYPIKSKRKPMVCNFREVDYKESGKKGGAATKASFERKRKVDI